MRKIVIGIIILISTSLGVTVLQAGEHPSLDDIVNKANLTAYYGGNDGKSTVRMIITDAQGRTRKREFVILRRDVKDGGEQKFYVYF